MSFAPTLPWYINDANQERTGLHLDLASTDAVTSIRFLRDDDLNILLGVVRPARKGIENTVWESADLSLAAIQIAVGVKDQAPTAGTWPLEYLSDNTGTSLLAFDISESALQTALNAHPLAVRLDTFTVNTGTDVVTVGSSHGLTAGDIVRFTTSNTLPAPLVVGTYYFVRAVGSGTAITLSTTLGGALLDLTTTGTGTHAIHSFVSVSKSGSRFFRAAWQHFGARSLLTSSELTNRLRPVSAVTISRDATGDSSTREVQDIELTQKPYAFQNTFTVVPPGTVTAETLEAGDVDVLARYRLTFSAPPLSGSIGISRPVQQQWSILASDNTASLASWEIDFEPIVGNEVAFNGQYLESYDGFNALLRFWFNNTGQPPLDPGIPAGMTKIQVDYTTVASLVAAFITAADADAEFSAVQISTYRVRVSHSAEGKRTPISLTFAPELDPDTTLMISAGSDGLHAGKYLPLSDRNGPVVLYFTAGLTTEIPAVDSSIPVRRFIQVPLVIGAADSVVADAIKTAVDDDPEFTATQGGAQVTITDAYAGARTSYSPKTTNFGIAVQRAGFNITASIPWQENPETIKTLLGERFNVNKVDDLHWVLTETVAGEMPDLDDPDTGDLVWPSLLEGRLQFTQGNLHSALALADGEDEIDSEIEIVITPVAEGPKVILQLPCTIARNLIVQAVLSSFTWPQALLAVATGNLLWLDEINGSVGGVRGRLDKPFNTPDNASDAALAGDTIIGQPGDYVCAGNVAANEVSWNLQPGARFTLSDDSISVGIFDDGGAAMQFVVTGDGIIVRDQESIATQAILLSHADSDFRFTLDRLEINSSPSNEVVIAAIRAMAGTLHFKAREIIATESFAWGVWWDNGPCYVEADLIQADNYAVYGACNATPTGEFVVVAKEIIGATAVYCDGTDSTAAMWVTAAVIRGAGASAGVAVLHSAANKLYVNAQKLFGVVALSTGSGTAGLSYIKASKISAVANSGAIPALFKCDSPTANAWIEIPHWDPVSFTGDMIVISAGVVRIKGMNFKGGASAKGIALSGGTLILEDCVIDTSANSSTDPITKSGGTLIFQGGRSKLIAHSTRNSISAPTGQDVIQITPYATNKAKDSDVTLRVVTTELVDATYILSI